MPKERLNQDGVDTRVIRSIEWNDLITRYPVFAEKFLFRFADSALLNPYQEWSAKDVTKAREFLQDVVPFAHERLRGTWAEDSLLCELYLGNFAKEHPEFGVSEYEAKVLGLLHDTDRLGLPHRYLLTNVLGNRAAKQLGVRTDFLAKLDPVERILGYVHPVKSIDEYTDHQAGHMVFDNLGKNRNGALFILKTWKNYTKNMGKRYANTDSDAELPQFIKDEPWRTSELGLRRLELEGKGILNRRLVLDARKRLYQNYHVDFRSLRSKVEKEYNTSENQEWLSHMKETLDHPVSMIVFDVGNVLLTSDDNELFRRLSATLQIPQEALMERVNELFTDALASKISTQEFLSRIYSLSNVPMPDSVEEAGRIFYHPDLYQPLEGMPELVQQLADQGADMAILSDAISLVIPPVRDALRRYYPALMSKIQLFSAEQHVAKRQKDTMAFRVALRRLGITDPRTVLFVDDKQEFIKAANKDLLRGYWYNGKRATKRLKELLLMINVLQ